MMVVSTLSIIMDSLRNNRIKPIAFHPYPSTVIDGLICISDKDGKTAANALFELLEEKFIRLFTEAGIKCAVDNKIVFECTIDTIKFYFGFKDSSFTVGFGLFKSR